MTTMTITTDNNNNDNNNNNKQTIRVPTNEKLLEETTHTLTITITKISITTTQ